MLPSVLSLGGIMKRLKKTKVYQSIKAFFSKIKSSLSAFGTKRILLIILGVVVLYLLIAPFFPKGKNQCLL